MPADLPAAQRPNEQFARTLPLFHDYSVTEKFGVWILLNVEKTVQLKYRLYCRGEPVKGGRSIGKRDSKSGRTRSGNFVSISSVALLGNIRFVDRSFDQLIGMAQ